MSILIHGGFRRLSNIPGNRWAEDKYSVPPASKTYQQQLQQTGWLRTDLTAITMLVRSG